MASQSSQVTLADALVALQSDRLEESRKGVEILKEVLTYNRNDGGLRRLADKSIHTIFEPLFRAISIERATYIKGSKSISRSTSASRLADDASVLRLAVTMFVDRLKKKTVKALIRHMLQALPTSNGRYCAPLALNYLKALGVVLSYQPHVEHLEPALWLDSVDFCIEGLSPSKLLEPEQTLLELSFESKKLQPQQSAYSTTTKAETTENIVELLGCLRSLLQAPNGPKARRVNDVLPLIVQFLKSSPVVTAGHHAAVQAINSVLLHIKVNAGGLVTQFLLDLIVIIRTLWPRTRTEHLLADEMLICLLHLHGFLFTPLDDDARERYLPEIEALVHVLQNEYCSFRDERRGHIELSDVGLTSGLLPHLAARPMQLRSFYLQRCTPKAERTWAELQFISLFMAWLDSQLSSLMRRTAALSTEEHPQKRVRNSLQLDELLDQTNSKAILSRVSALQILAFLVHQSMLSVEQLVTVLERLLESASHQNVDVATWTLVSIASCAFQKHATSAVFEGMWTKVWQISIRLISSQPLCRAASHVVDVVLATGCIKQVDVLESLDMVLYSPNVTGPAVLCDSAVDVWMKISHIKAAGVTESVSNTIHEQSLHWLCTKWTPSSLENRSHAERIRREVRPRQIYASISESMAGRAPRFESPEFVELGTLGQAWVARWNSRKLMDYLLIIDEDRLSSTAFSHPLEYSATNTTVLALQRKGCKQLILRFLTSEVQSLNSIWRSAHIQGTANGDMVHLAFSFCLVTLMVLMDLESHDSKQVDSLRENVENFCNEIITTCFAGHVLQGPRIIALLSAVMPFLPDVSSSTGCKDFFMVIAALTGPIQGLAEALESYSGDPAGSTSGSRIQIDSLDVISGVTGERVLPPNHTHGERLVPDALSSERSSYTSAATYLAFAAANLNVAEADKISKLLPSLFVEHITSLFPFNFLASCNAIDLVLQSSLQLRPADAETLLVYLANSFLAPYEWSHCESSLWLCLRIMLHTITLWTNQKYESLAEAGADMYKWFVEATTSGQISSHGVQMAIVDLLYGLLAIQADYGHNLSMPSVRTVLFGVLKNGDIQVQYHVTERLPTLFNAFSPAQHDVIFDDVHNSLPEEVEWTEGISIRLLVYMNLASAWPTLLRRSLYHIFEIAGLVPLARGHARQCVTQIVTALRLTDSQTLLRLFAPQLLYTWLELQTLHAMPFGIFGYGTLRAMVLDIQTEVLAQLIMRSADDQLKQLELITGVAIRGMMIKGFSRSVAYGVVKDVAQGSASHEAETRIRDTVGKDVYLRLLEDNLHEVISILFLHLEDEDQLDRALAKRKTKTYDKTCLTIEEIKQISCSTARLPAGQQPSFKGKAVIDAMERLFRRSGDDPRRDSPRKSTIKVNPFQFWSPIRIIAVSRNLFDDIQPIFGELHTCRIIRRLRLVVAFAESQALAGYPLEMLLHALKPLAAKQEYSEDAIGIFEYLLHYGKPYLTSIPSSVAAICLPLFLSLNQLLNSKASESGVVQHSTRLSIVKEFHAWLSRYLDSYVPAGSDDAALQKFSRIIDLARHVTGPINGCVDTVEGRLLLALLDDVGSSSNIRLLSQSALEACFALISNHFSAPVYNSDDILGDGETSYAYSTALWRSLEFTHITNTYTTWAARGIGRAFGHHGDLPQEIFGETRFKHFIRMCKNAHKFMPSKKAIIGVLIESVQATTSQKVGLAEQSLQYYLLKAMRTEESALIGQCFPHSLSLLSTLSLSEAVLISSLHDDVPMSTSLDELFRTLDQQPYDDWIRAMSIALIALATTDPLLQTLPTLLHTSSSIADNLFPFILHLVLLGTAREKTDVRQGISEGFQAYFGSLTPSTTPHLSALINALLYLRCQAGVFDTTLLELDHWLDLDYYQIARAASHCKMFKSALLFIDIAQTPVSRASKTKKHELPSDIGQLLSSIYSSIDEPDSFYGVKQSASIESIVQRHDFEGNGIESLVYRSAQLDSDSRGRPQNEITSASPLLSSLSMLNLNTLVRSLIGTESRTAITSDISGALSKAAMSLGQWDLPRLENTSSKSILYCTLQSIYNSDGSVPMAELLDVGILDCFKMSRQSYMTSATQRSAVATLASLTEARDIASASGRSDLELTMQKLKLRNDWMSTGPLKIVVPMLTARTTFGSMITRKESLRDLLQLSTKESFVIQVDLDLHASRILRKVGALSESLSLSTYLVDTLVQEKNFGIEVDGAVRFELANVLWDRGEVLPSIDMIREIKDSCRFSSQTIPIGTAEILATLGQRISQARLENPSTIVQRYLTPALAALKGNREGYEAAHAFHEFATYCHNQLTNIDNVDEFQRIERFKRQKETEIRELGSAVSNSKNKVEKHQAEKAIKEAQRWLHIDNQEYERLRSTRAEYLTQSLTNYLNTLAADDSFDTDIIKFTALWYEYSDDEAANLSVKDGIGRVPSRKFAPLMNQFTSRLQNEESEFQTILGRLIHRVCHDHPYHGMYQVSASSRTSGGSDSQGQGRKQGALLIAEKLSRDPNTAKIWTPISKANELYNKLARFKHDELRANGKYALRSIEVSKRVEKEVPPLRVPPITATIGIRADFDYSTVAIINHFKPDMTVLGGLSAPKLLTVIDSNGRQHRQLLKGGSDDLRQDAIMEQVFAQVTELLRQNKSTRQRDLRIRTYNVVPLDANTGAIEFVQPTMSLLDYLMPAHARYHPSDYKWKTCREKVEKSSDMQQSQRIKAFQDVCSRFTPVLRHFFFERFQDPDDWFDRRLAYTRSTAAISILGHVLGLGDRHCQNILLDTSTGEVVHIDLGVAFEAGRILPKPETVPFRLTRDIIDGFGVLKTDGVFQRCSEFTLEALRQNKDTILTLLNVFRYDPLYTWSVSPLRAKRLQAEQQQISMGPSSATPGTSKSRRTSAIANAEAEDAEEQKRASKKREEETGEAARALSVVEKKLAAGLSVTATVNELIQQATDDSNLAVLFHGWAAYA